jgi:hypothetical protein
VPVVDHRRRRRRPRQPLPGLRRTRQHPLPRPAGRQPRLGAVNTLFGSTHLDETNASCSPSPTRCKTHRTAPRSSPGAPTASTSARDGRHHLVGRRRRPRRPRRRALRQRQTPHDRFDVVPPDLTARSAGAHGLDRRPDERGLEILATVGLRSRRRVRACARASGAPSSCPGRRCGHPSTSPSSTVSPTSDRQLRHSMAR